MPVSSAAPKTQATAASVDDFIAAQPDEARRADCRALVALMQQASGQPPVMWGSSIIGFGSQLSGGNPWPQLAFAPRKAELVLYGMHGVAPELLARLGRHKTGKSCLYLKRLADVDGAVLAQIVRDGMARPA